MSELVESGVYTAEQLEAEGYVRISQAARDIDINLGWLRTKVRKGLLVEGEDYVRSDKKWIYFSQEAVDSMIQGQLERAERKQLRAEGKLPKGKAVYTPAKVSGLKSFRKWVRESGYDAETKAIVEEVITDALEEFIAEWQARRDAKAAEAEAEEGAD